jgi:hypothetical protein
MFPYLDSGLDAILNYRTLAFSRQLLGPILNPNAVPRCEHNDRGGNRIAYQSSTRVAGTPLGYVALLPPMLRPPLMKIDLHLEAFCLAEFKFFTV